MPLSTIASNQIKNDTIVDADINSSGNITTSKLGTGAVLQVVFTAKILNILLVVIVMLNTYL